MNEEKTRNGRLVQICVETSARDSLRIYAKTNLLQLQTVFDRAMWWLAEERKVKRVLYRASPKRGVLLNVLLSWSMINIVNALAREDNTHRRSVIFTGLIGFLEKEGVIGYVKDSGTTKGNNAKGQHFRINEERA